jgi:hypothetical protein
VPHWHIACTQARSQSLRLAKTTGRVAFGLVSGGGTCNPISRNRVSNFFVLKGALLYASKIAEVRSTAASSLIIPFTASLLLLPGTGPQR